MSADTSFSVVTGYVCPVPVPVTAVDVSELNGPCVLYGWSLREASGDTSQQNEGSVTSPAALQTIVTLTGIPAGNYSIEWTVELAGTLAAGDANNFELKDSAGNVLQSVNLAVAGQYPQQPVEATLAASSSVTIEALAVGTVGAVYSAQLVITPASITDAQAEIRDGNQPLGESGMPVGGSDTQFFGAPGVTVRNTVTLHVVSGIVTGVVYILMD